MIEQVLVPGVGSGPVLVLAEPLSFWGGLEPTTGVIIDRRHPQVGARVSGMVLALPVGRGSSSGSSVLAEAIRLGTAPAAIVMREPDEIVALGAVVAEELYGRTVPVVVLGAETFDRLETGWRIEFSTTGEVEITEVEMTDVEPARAETQRLVD